MSRWNKEIMENEVCRREIGHVAHSVLGEIYGPSFNLVSFKYQKGNAPDFISMLQYNSLIFGN